MDRDIERCLLNVAPDEQLPAYEIAKRIGYTAEGKHVVYKLKKSGLFDGKQGLQGWKVWWLNSEGLAARSRLLNGPR